MINVKLFFKILSPFSKNDPYFLKFLKKYNSEQYCFETVQKYQIWTVSLSPTVLRIYISRFNSKEYLSPR